MRVWGIAAASVAFVAAAVTVSGSPSVWAQPASAGVTDQSDQRATGPTDANEQAGPPPRLGYGALPGGLRVATAEALPPGTITVAALGGYGRRTGLLGGNHEFTRAIGDLAFAYVPVRHLMVGLSLDGRYDSHTGLRDAAGDPAPDDDAYVGDPHLMVRYAARSGKVMYGGQLGVWAPGNEAPSIVASAISVDARALLSIDAGRATISANAGFRIDNSASSVDGPNELSFGDRVSLGVSDFSAALVGASLRVAVSPRFYFGLEGSGDWFVGDGAPGPILRGGGLAGVALTDAVTLVGFVELARVPKPATDPMAGSLVPYEPAGTAGLGFQARFGGPRRPEGPSTIVGPGKGEPVIVIETADVSGVVFDDTGRPVVGAQVTVKLKNKTGTTATDGKGVYTVTGLPIGKTIDGKTELDDTAAELTIEVENKKPSTTTLTLGKGINSVAPVTLDPVLPPGELRGGIVNAANGRPLPAAAAVTVTVEPGGITPTIDDKGKFSVNLAPGRYKITVTARGFAQQQLDVTIEQNGVAIKNIELRK